MRKARQRNIIRNVIVFVVTFVSVLLFFHFIRFPVVDGDSMLPTYHHGNRLVMLHTHSVSDGDVAVLWDEDLGDYIVKRVIGVPGDHLQIDGGCLYRNGVRLYEPYVFEHDWIHLDSGMDVIVPDGCVYVMGDNRNNSADSRVLGTFDRSDVFGKILFKIGR